MKNFLKGTTILMAGDLLTKIISVLYLIPLVRINDQITILMANLLIPFSFFMVFSTLGINIILSNELVKSPENQRKTLINVGLILFFLTVIGSIIMFFISPYIMNNIELNEVYARALVIGSRALIVGVILFSITSYLRAIMLSYGDYTIISITYITEQLIRVGIIIAGCYYTLVLNSYDVSVVVYIITFAIIISIFSTFVIYLIYFFKKKHHKKFQEGRYEFSYKYIKYLLYSAIVLFSASIYITFFDMIDLLFFNKQMINHGYAISQINEFKNEYFTLSFKIIMVPITISAAFIQVMIKQVGESMENKKEINMIIFIVSLYTIFMTGGIMATGQDVYLLFYGKASTGIIIVQSLIIPAYILKNVISGYLLTNRCNYFSVFYSTIVILVSKVVFDILFFNVFQIYGYVLSSLLALALGTYVLINRNRDLFVDGKYNIKRNTILFIKAIVLFVLTIKLSQFIVVDKLLLSILVEGILFIIMFIIFYFKDVKSILKK